MKALTFRMEQVLLALHEGQDPVLLFHGMSERGGLTQVWAGLQQRGLVVTADGGPAWRGAEWVLTDAGRAQAQDLKG
jgi:hypothetical protein